MANFSKRFYSSVQFLSGVNALTDFDAKIIITNTHKPHEKIHIAMLPDLVNNYKTYKITQYLKHVKKVYQTTNKQAGLQFVCFPENNYCNSQAS